MAMSKARAAVLAEPIANSWLVGKAAGVDNFSTGSTLLVLGSPNRVGADGARIGLGELLQEIDLNGLLGKVSGGQF